MLISFTFENWKSYGEENCLNLQAGSKKSHAEQLASLLSYPSLKILPLTAVYGSNASGKTNLFTALAFVKKYITQGPELHNNSLLEKPIKTIPVTPCHTGTINYTKKPTSFTIVFAAQQPDNLWNPRNSKKYHSTETIYELEFSLYKDTVISEKLSYLLGNGTAKTLYTRDKNGITLSDKLKTVPDYSLLNEACSLMINNQETLFLTYTIFQRIPTFSAAWQWFNQTLNLWDNNTFIPIKTDEHYLDVLSHVLHAMDTGITTITATKVTNPPEQIQKFTQQFTKGNKDSSVRITALCTAKDNDGIPIDIYAVETGGGRESQISQLQTEHNGHLIGFGNESSGTRRLIEVSLILFDIFCHKNNHLWILDNIEREFHTGLTELIVRIFLDKCTPETRTQVILSTHDFMLMDQNLLRPDEILIIDRDNDGLSTMTPLDAYQGIRNDLDIRCSYCEGRFGGIPSFNRVQIEGELDRL